MNFDHKPSEDIAIDPYSICRIGVVLSVDLANARCTVRVGDANEGAIETPPIRWLAMRAGETRIWSPPSIGEQVMLLCAGGELAAGVAITGIISDNFGAAGSDKTELISFADGAVLAYDPENHALNVALPDNSSVTVVADSVRFTGNVQIDGNVQVGGNVDVADDVTAGPNNTSLTSHRHLGVTTGMGVSGAPQP